MELITPGIGLIFWMSTSFLIVFFLLKKFAWSPILGMIKDREKSIEDALRKAEIAKEDMKLFQNQGEKLMNEAKVERDNLLKEARELRDNTINEAKLKASLEAEKLLSAARMEIQNEKNQAISEIKNQVAVLSVEIAEKILKNELRDEAKQKGFVEGLLSEIKLN
jgi:F-type H+-transporting ATPase subunit b